MLLKVKVVGDGQTVVKAVTTVVVVVEFLAPVEVTTLMVEEVLLAVLEQAVGVMKVPFPVPYGL